MTRHPTLRRLRGIAFSCASAAVVLAGCSTTGVSERPVSGELEQSTDYPGFVVEPAAEIGPHAFTASVTDDVKICDKTRLLAELQANPDAHREWARVLSLREEDVSGYVMSLTPQILDADTPVTNHGLANGIAYPRLSVLTAGTAVLVDERQANINFPPPEIPPEVPPENPPDESTTTTTTTGPPGSPPPVTRCKCGNPLLLPPLPPETTSTTTTLQQGGQILRDDDGSSSTRRTTTTTTKQQQGTPPEPATPGEPEPPGGPTDDVPPDQNQDYPPSPNDPDGGP